VYLELLKEPEFKSFAVATCEEKDEEPIAGLTEVNGAVYSKKLSVSGVSCGTTTHTIDVYRFGVIKPIPYVPLCTTYRDLIVRVQDVFNDYLISNLWARDGTRMFEDDLVKPFPPAPYKQVLMATHVMRSPRFDYEEEERFYYPALEVGEVVTLHLPDSTGTIRDVNLTTLSIQPKIFSLDDFLSHEECDEVLQYMYSGEPEVKWSPSTVGIDHTDEGDGGTYRVSETLWISEENSIEVTDRLHSRTQSLLKHPVELMEPFQAVRYKPGGHYYFHTDSFTESDKKGQNPYIVGGGNRLATLILYLREPPGGGGTAFPKKGREDPNEEVEVSDGCNPEKSFIVYPKKGAAVLFYDLIEDSHMAGITDLYTEHGGCDTIEGESEKLIMNQWYRNKRVKVEEKWHMYDTVW